MTSSQCIKEMLSHSNDREIIYRERSSVSLIRMTDAIIAEEEVFYARATLVKNIAAAYPSPPVWDFGAIWSEMMLMGYSIITPNVGWKIFLHPHFVESIKSLLQGSPDDLSKLFTLIHKFPYSGEDIEPGNFEYTWPG